MIRRPGAQARYSSTRNTVVPVRPNTSGAYIWLATAGPTTKVPGMLARTW